MRKLGLFLLMLILTISGVNVQAAEREGMSAVLIVDTSGSMVGTDRNRIAIEATKLFIDMMENNGSQVAVIAFNSDIAMEIPLTKINSQEDKEKIKSQIDTLRYDGETDMGIALKRGCEILAASGMERNNVIVFFTDGKIDFYTSNTTRTIAQSEREVDDAINSIKGKFPIYTIGLNANGGVDENIIGKMASETGGEKYVVTDASELTKIYNTIFAKFIKSNLIDINFPPVGADNKTVATVNIPNGSVFEANIVAFADQPLTDISAVSPTGQTVSAVKNISDQYAMLKLMDPEPGDWTITVAGSSGCQVEATMLFNYDVQIQTNIDTSASYSAGDSVQVEATLSGEDGVITDDSFYDSIYAEGILTKPDNSTENFTMTYAEGGFTGEVTLPEEGDYSITVRANGDNFYRVSDPVTVSAGAAAEPTTAAQVSRQTTTAVPEDEGMGIIPIIAICVGVILAIILLILGLRKYGAYKFKTKNLKGSITVIDENNNEAEYTLAGKKGGTSLYDIAEDTDTEFDLKKIRLYFSYDRETCVEFVNKSSYQMTMNNSLTGNKSSIVVRSGEGITLTEKISEEESRTLIVRYEYY